MTPLRAAPGRGRLWIKTASWCCLAPAACWLVLSAEIIDRIAISVGNQVITESQIDEEVRVTQFLNGEKLELSAGEKKKAADRLVEQALVKREMELSRYPVPAQDEAANQLDSVRAAYSNAAKYQDALQAHGIAEAALVQHLWWQLTLLRFVEYRFRPGIQIPDSDVQAYYKEQVAKWQREGRKPIPPLEELRGQMEQILTEQRIDDALDRWLVEARMQVDIRYLDEALK